MATTEGTSTTTPNEIVSRLKVKFEKAKEAGDLLFFPSTVQKHKEGEVEYEIRLCPALQHKPHLPTPHFDPRQKDLGKKPDPFEAPYVENLYIGEVEDEDNGKKYVALLNKYCVIPLHFLLASKMYESQASPLLPPDLVQTYLILLAAKKAGSPFFAFYNCGDRSGASQPHKHIQFLPLEDEDGPPVERLAKAAQLENPGRPFSLSSLPYANHVFRLPSMTASTPAEEIEEKLSQAFLSLLDLVVSTVRHSPDYPAGTPSYNVLLTLEHLHLIPRAEENYTLQETGDQLSINAVGFAGMPLVKSDEEMEAVKREGVGKILRGVGLESVHDMQVEGTAIEAEQLVESGSS
ncbi:ATP adenylyltransferase [Heliocybe sulcata]|uniref:ATP adenylyltransferase n=1 Tax=Heliocybe sulcata TaxID=5364 RepID=A0A5C3NCB8_9AGAM|nr:ATP adenylyltransferase [Heliocybe sulcata]